MMLATRRFFQNLMFERSRRHYVTGPSRTLRSSCTTPKSLSNIANGISGENGHQGPKQPFLERAHLKHAKRIVIKVRNTQCATRTIFYLRSKMIIPFLQFEIVCEKFVYYLFYTNSGCLWLVSFDDHRVFFNKWDLKMIMIQAIANRRLKNSFNTDSSWWEKCDCWQFSKTTSFIET